MPVPDAAEATLVGRADEQAAIDHLMASARRGVSGVLVLTGEAGVGKTALLEHAARTAADLQVAEVAGVGSEARMAYAALHRLLLPFLDRRDRLPEPQRDALGAAFGLVGGPPPDTFLVGLAALTLLADAATERPLLCVVDDAQWIDQESLEVLGFVGRRLLAEGVVLLFALREPSGERSRLEGLPTVTLGGLDEPSSVDLLVGAVDGFVDPAVARRLAGETMGNPLALVSLADDLTPGQLAGAALLPQPLPLGPKLEDRFLRQVRELPPDAQDLVLLAAADPTGDADVVTAAAAHLGLDPDVAEPAETVGLLTMRPRVRFRHPLVRSAVLGGASTDRRRRIHAALAAVADPTVDPECRAWHLAEAATGPDDEVAAEIEDAAEKTRRRGGYAAAAGAPATGRPAQPRRRSGAAPGCWRRPRPTSRRATRPRHMRPSTRRPSTSATPATRPTCSVSRGRSAWPKAGSPRPRRSCCGRRGRWSPSTPGWRGTRCWRPPRPPSSAGARPATPPWSDVARAAASVPLPEGTAPTSGDLLLDAFTVLFTDGHAAAAPLLRRAVDALAGEHQRGAELLRWLGSGCWAAGALGDNEALRQLARQLVQRSRDAGALRELTRGLYFLGMGDVVAGDLAAAGSHFSESRELMAARGDTTSLGEVIATAWRGDGEATHAEVSRVAEAAAARGQGGVVVYTEHALAVLALGGSQYDAALASARRVDDEDSYFLSTVALPDLVEAAVRSGDPGLATDALDRCRRRAEASGTALALGLAARASALVEEDEAAEDRHREALDLLAGTPAAGHLARAELLYGEWLRRRRRRVDAREQLRAAHERFTDIGALGFAERARHELEATGERARRRTVETANELTPQEAKVAELAAQRATNGEIAAQLFISPATVDYHLRKVFRKLGVSSRRDLPDVLSQPGG